MATIRRFEVPEIWQIGRKLSLKVFRITQTGLSLQDHKFKNQIRASGGSVKDSMAGGFERSSQFELVKNIFPKTLSN